MKRYSSISRIALVLTALSLLSSCSLLGPRSGSLAIPFPSELLNPTVARSIQGPEGRAIATGILGYVRVYLETQGGLLPLNGAAAVFEAKIPADNTLTIEDIPPVRNCTLYVSLSELGSADFRVVKFAKSPSFNLVAGATATVTLEAIQSPFRDLSTKSDAAGVRALSLGGVTYFLSGGILYRDDGVAALSIVGASNGITTTQGLNAGKQVNTDGSFGSDCVWISTDAGVWVLSADGSSISRLEVTDSEGVSHTTTDSVLECRTIGLSYTDTDNMVVETNTILYQGNGILGGAYSSNGSWKWFTLAENMDKLGTLKDSIEKATSKLVADFWTSPDGSYGYAVIPAVNSLRIGGDVVSKMSGLKDPDAQLILDTFLAGNTIAVPQVSGKNPSITGVSKAGNTLFIGTDLGVFSASVAPADGKLATDIAWTHINLGKNVAVVQVRAVMIGTTVWTALLAKSGALYLLKDGSLVAEYPFYSGIPQFGGDAGKTGSIFWTSAGLIVSGTNGTVLLDAVGTDKLWE